MTSTTETKTVKDTNECVLSDQVHLSGKTLYRGLKVVHGVRDPKPILGAPTGKQRLRMRNDSPATLFVNTENGIRKFILEDLGAAWFCNPQMEQGRNIRNGGG